MVEIALGGNCLGGFGSYNDFALSMSVFRCCVFLLSYYGVYVCRAIICHVQFSLSLCLFLHLSLRWLCIRKVMVSQLSWSCVICRSVELHGCCMPHAEIGKAFSLVAILLLWIFPLYSNSIQLWWPVGIVYRFSGSGTQCTSSLIYSINMPQWFLSFSYTKQWKTSGREKKKPRRYACHLTLAVARCI